MKPRKLVSTLAKALITSTLVLGSFASAAEYPSKQIEVIVPYSAGGGTDLVTRAFADAAKQYLPEAMGVVNKTGGGGAVGLSEIVRARADGYHIGMGTVELAMLPHLGMVTFQAEDFVPIARLNAEPSAISVNADAPWQTYEEFIAHAKANPGAVRIGNSGTGAIWHLAAEAVADKTGAQFSHIPYDGANPAVTALLGGHIEAVTVSPAEVANHVNNGKVRILTIMSDERIAGFEDIPTLKESGVDLSIMTWRGIVVPKKTPEDIQMVLREAVKQTANDEGFKSALAKMNLTHAYLDAPEFQKTINRDDVFFKDLMKKLGLGS